MTRQQDSIDVLLVDDSQVDVELTIRALKKTVGLLKIHIANNGMEALDYLFGLVENGSVEPLQLPLLILLDLKLPAMDGLEVLQKIKSDNRLTVIPVILLTSSKEDRDIKAAYNAGVNSFIVKPVDFEKYMEIVGQIGVYWLRMNESPIVGNSENKW